MFTEMEQKGLAALEFLKKNEKEKMLAFTRLAENYGDFLKAYRSALLSSRNEESCLGEDAPADVKVFLFELERV